MADAVLLSDVPNSAKTKREQYEQLRASMLSERQGSFDSHWRDLSDYIFPRRTRFWTGDRNRGDKRNQKIIDSTGSFSARTKCLVHGPSAASSCSRSPAESPSEKA